VTAPYKIDRYDNQFPIGTTSQLTEATDKWLGLLNGYGIHTIDMREEYHNLGYNIWDVMYKTDHHWTPQGAFIAFQSIVNNYLSGVDLPQLDLLNYNITEYPDCAWGSEARRTVGGIAKPESEFIISPKFETRIRNNNTNKIGSFEEILINRKYFEDRIHLGPYNCWVSIVGDWIFAQTPVVANREKNEVHTSNLMPDGVIEKRVMFIGDSFLQNINYLSAITFRETLSLYYNGVNNKNTLSKDNINKWLDEFNPDLVVYLRTQRGILDDNFYYK
jgi:hypothetical protein